MQLRWAHIVIYVRDTKKMVDFYTDVLGFEVTDRGPIGPEGREREIVFLSQVDTDHHQVAFINARKGEEPPNSVDHIAFRTADINDVREMISKLSGRKDVSGISPITHGNAWSVYFRDPENNGVEVFTDTPWHVAQPQGQAWDPALDDEALIKATKAQFGAEPEFGPIEAFYERRAAELKNR
ncbi:MAG: VOC family protein [Proteobacteria bacterium]|nr:VOC family protein [Pseudomonadota bacterium]